MADNDFLERAQVLSNGSYMAYFEKKTPDLTALAAVFWNYADERLKRFFLWDIPMNDRQFMLCRLTEYFNGLFFWDADKKPRMAYIFGHEYFDNNSLVSMHFLNVCNDLSYEEMAVYTDNAFEVIFKQCRQAMFNIPRPFYGLRRFVERYGIKKPLILADYCELKEYRRRADGCLYALEKREFEEIRAGRNKAAA